jgi:hypothetical protein
MVTCSENATEHKVISLGTFIIVRQNLIRPHFKQ